MNIPAAQLFTRMLHKCEKAIQNRLALPRVLAFCQKYQQTLSIAALLFLILGWIGGLFIAPKDEEMGDGFRIIYVHVPLAVASMGIYTFMALCAVGVYIYKSKALALFIRKSSLLGAAVTALTLITGAIWGHRMWGAWWIWGDARLVSELILLFMYIGHAALLYTLPNTHNSDQTSAILLMIGWVNIPIIHFSVMWWTSLHQGPTLFKLGAPNIPMSMLWPLLCALLGTVLLCTAYIMLRSSTYLLTLKHIQTSHHHG